MNVGRPKIKTWDAHKKEHPNQFLITNTAWVGRERLKKLRQIGTIWEYVKVFNSCLLNIEDMLESDKLFNFLTGL